MCIAEFLDFGITFQTENLNLNMMFIYQFNVVIQLQKNLFT